MSDTDVYVSPTRVPATIALVLAVVGAGVMAWSASKERILPRKTDAASPDGLGHPRPAPDPSLRDQRDDALAVFLLKVRV